MDKIYFGKNLSYLRKQKKKTANDLAIDIGFSRTQWANYENEISVPKFNDLIKISKYFDVSETTLIHSNIELDGLSVEIPDNYTFKIQKKLIQKLEEEIFSLKKELESKNPYRLVSEPTPELKKNPNKH